MSDKVFLLKIKAPQFWLEFAHRYGISEVVLIKGEGPCKSMIMGDTIIIDIEYRGIRGYRKILDVTSYEEVITAKFLHELAHYVKKHYSYKKKQSKIICLEDVCERSVEEILSDRCEREAWEFVAKFKHENPELFQALVEAVREYLN
ncbi:MAG TPA: hypothetical protein ENG39_02715 [Candidatus Omnitrophica bacterium]|nr:hypothetical protein [Candidatus Omnitrophota bacterium]